MTEIVMAAWWPADVAMPDGTGVKRARVYVTAPDGEAPAEVIIYDHTAVTTGKPLLRSALAAGTPEPPAANTWPRPDIDLRTADGLVVVRPTGGCGCGHPLRAWTPEWASRRTPWRTS